MKNYLMTLPALACAAVFLAAACRPETTAQNPELFRAAQTLDSIYAHYSVEGSCLLRENCPSGFADYAATLCEGGPHITCGPTRAASRR